MIEVKTDEEFYDYIAATVMDACQTVRELNDGQLWFLLCKLLDDTDPIFPNRTIALLDRITDTLKHD